MRTRSGPRSTERAIAARMAVHAEWLAKEQLDRSVVVDDEYERVGDGTDPKLVWQGTAEEHRMSPDLVVHSRTVRSANYLAVEVKRATVRKRRAWRGGPDALDLDKIAWLTHLSTLTNGEQHSYDWGVCLELSREGATFWWLEGGQLGYPTPGSVVEEDIVRQYRHRSQMRRC